MTAFRQQVDAGLQAELEAVTAYVNCIERQREEVAHSGGAYTPEMDAELLGLQRAKDAARAKADALLRDGRGVNNG